MAEEVVTIKKLGMWFWPNEWKFKRSKIDQNYEENECGGQSVHYLLPYVAISDFKLWL